MKLGDYVRVFSWFGVLTQGRIIKIDTIKDRVYIKTFKGCPWYPSHLVELVKK